MRTPHRLTDADLPARLTRLVLLTALTGLVLPATAGAITFGAGWTRSDVGLDAKGDGVYLAVGETLAWDNPIFDARIALEYVQKKGSQPTPFSDPVAGFVTEDAEVTLHVVEPAVFLGARLPGLPVVPRLYVGTSIGLKVKESWSDFPGVPDRAYGYKDTDFVAHLGLTVDVGPATVDVRWSRSLVGQLLFDNRDLPLAKADAPGDVRVPEEGFKTETLRVGVAVSF